MKKKKCSKCKVDKELSEFNKNKARPDGYATFCRECMCENSKKYYSEHKDKMVKQIADTKKKRVTELRKKVNAYKGSMGCFDCKDEFDAIVLQFDHINDDKELAISKAISHGYSWKTIEKEIKKCQVVCANCHIRRTAKQLGWYNK